MPQEYEFGRRSNFADSFSSYSFLLDLSDSSQQICDGCRFGVMSSSMVVLEGRDSASYWLLITLEFAAASNISCLFSNLRVAQTWGISGQGSASCELRAASCLYSADVCLVTINNEQPLFG